jgi:sugar transferase (PEP-CTERM/EpsH1 system associated)
MPIRIMHVVYGLGRGGIQTGLENLLGRLDHNKFEHIVCALRPPIDHPMCQGLAHLAQVMCLRTTESDSRFHISAIASAIREVKPDIVHSRNWGSIEAVPAARWVGSCRVVHGEHGFDSDMVGGEPRRRAWFRRAAFEMADRVLSVSYQARDLHSRNTGFPADRVTVIHNGVNERIYFPDAAARDRIRAELGMANNEFLIGSVANLAPVKDHMTTLRALAELDRTVKNWRCLIIGDGPERPRMEAFLNEYPEWKSRVSLYGLTRRVPELLRAMDVMVLSSVTEGICNSLLEAMASGVPVVATRTGGNPEIIVDRQSGFLFPVGDVKQLTENLILLQGREDLRLELGRQAVRRMQDEFSLDSMARNYDGVYSSLRPPRPVPNTSCADTAPRLDQSKRNVL